MRALDEQLLRLARSRGHGPRRDRALAGLSRLGEHGGLWLVLGAGGYLLDGGRRPQWRAAVAAVAGAYALNTAIKGLVRRPRPRLAGLPPLVSTPTRLSFPSAHASTSFAGARCYARLGLPRPALYAMAATLSFSRVYLGVHYPSDVLGGALLGAAIGGRTSPRPSAPAGGR